MQHKKKYRVIVRPWVPRRLPTQIPTSRVKDVLEIAYPKLGSVVYVGWTRRYVDGKKSLMFLAATGDSAKEARTRFKTSKAFGDEVWRVDI